MLQFINGDSWLGAATLSRLLDAAQTVIPDSPRVFHRVNTSLSAQHIASANRRRRSEGEGPAAAVQVARCPRCPLPEEHLSLSELCTVGANSFILSMCINLSRHGAVLQSQTSGVQLSQRAD